MNTRRGTQRIGSIAAAAALLWTAATAAQARREVRLEYTRGAGADHCPAEDAIRSAVSARLGYEPFRADATTTVTAKITRTGRVLRAEVELREAGGDVAGARQLTSKENDCSELVAAMTLAISIAIDPQSQTRPAPPSGPAEPSAPGAPAGSPPGGGSPEGAPPGPPAPALPTEAPPRAPIGRASARLAVPQRGAPPVVGRLGAGVLVAAGTAPSPTVGFVAAPGIGWGSLSADLEGRIDLRASTKADFGAGSVSSRLMTLSLVPCWHTGALAACGLASIGVLRGEGHDVEPVRDDETLFVALGVRLGAELELADRLAGYARADLTAIATPTTLELDGRAVWKTPPVAAALGFGLETHFP